MASPKPFPTVRGALAACRSAFLAIFVISAVLNLLMLTGPIYMLQVYDRVLASNSVPTLVALSGIALFLYAFNGLIDILRTRALARIGARVHVALGGPVLRANTRLPVLLGHKAAALHPGRDLEAVRRFLTSPGPGAIFDLPFMPLYFALVFLLHPALGWMALGGGLLIFVLVLANEFASREPAREANQRTAVQSRLMDGARRNAEVVGAMGMVGTLVDRNVGLMADYHDAQNAASDSGNLYSSMIKLVRLVLQSGMLGLGAYLVIHQEATAGVMIAASIIMARAISPIEQAVSFWPLFVAARQARTRLEQVLAQTGRETGVGGLPLPKDNLTVDGLFATAPGEAAVLLQNLQFDLAAGDAVGVIGPSGSGKTTLARVLVGVWAAGKGSVRLDGSTLDQWTEAERGRIIGYLPQDVELFDGTVAENIARFDPNASIENVVEAAKLAGVHQLVVGLEGGYECRIGEGGARLSAGQRQRIALARALYGNPFLVVLDEPNSNLDLEGETALARAIEGVRARGGIVVVIAHRRTALAAVNKVLMLMNGQRAAFGDRDEVLSKITMIKSETPSTGTYSHAV